MLDRLLANLTSMPDESLIEAVIDAARRMCPASLSGDVEGAEIAHEVGRDPDDVDLYYAFQTAERRGDLECLAWIGGMGLPGIVRIP